MVLASVDAGPILAYVLLFVAVAICWAGIPFVGAAALGAAGAAASQGRLDITVVAVRAYARWGPVAAFLTSAIVSGTAKMNDRRFAIWNLVASLTFAVSIGHTADGLVRIVTGHHGGDDIAVLLLGLAAGTVLVVFTIRRHRHRARAVPA